MVVFYWIRDHLALVVALWIALGSAASLISRRLQPSYPRAAACAALVAGIFSDLLQVFESFLRAVGEPPSPPPPATRFRGTATPPSDPPPPVTQRRRTLWFLPPMLNTLAALALVVLAWACDVVRDPNTQSDATKLGICVLMHITEPPKQIVKDCEEQGITVTEDAVNDLIAAERVAAAQRAEKTAKDGLDELCVGRDAGVRR